MLGMDVFRPHEELGRKSKENELSCMFHKEILERWLTRKTWRCSLSAVKQWMLFSGKTKDFLGYGESKQRTILASILDKYCKFSNSDKILLMWCRTHSSEKEEGKKELCPKSGGNCDLTIRTEASEPDVGDPPHAEEKVAGMLVHWAYFLHGFI